MGFIYAIIAGSAMSIQGVMNTRLGEKAGLFEANTFVQGTAFVISLIIMLIWGQGSIKEIASAKPYTWFGGVIGVIITVTVMLSQKTLSPQLSVSSILIAQLIVAALIDTFAIMDTPKQPFGLMKIIGTALMIVGVVLIKLKK